MHKAKILRETPTTYYTGAPCGKGHDAPRYKSNRSCVECERIRRRAYAEKNREREVLRVARWRMCNPRKSLKIRRAHALKKRGFTTEDFHKMLEDQGGACAICEREFSVDLRACADHDHDTGRPRGVLCDRCNLLLGRFMESPNMMRIAAAKRPSMELLLKRAIAYLESR